MENQEEGPIEDLIGGHAMSQWGAMDLRGFCLHEARPAAAVFYLRCSVVTTTPSTGRAHGISAR